MLFITGCKIESIQEIIPCENCSSKLLDFNECKPICEARFEEAKGGVIFGQEIKTFKGYKKNVKWDLRTKEKTVSCICIYGS